jgi:hypothetical protein
LRFDATQISKLTRVGPPSAFIVDPEVHLVVDLREPDEVRSTSTPVNGGRVGKMTISYEMASRMLRRHPSRTERKAARAREEVCLIEVGLKILVRRISVEARALDMKLGPRSDSQGEYVCTKERPNSRSSPIASSLLLRGAGPLCRGGLSLAAVSLDTEEDKSCERNFGTLDTSNCSMSDLS